MPKDAIRVDFTASIKTTASSTLYLNSPAPSATVTRVYDCPTVFTKIHIVYDFFPKTTSIADQSKSVYNKISAAFGNKANTSSVVALPPAVLEKDDFDHMSEEDTSQVGVSLSGIVYLGLVTACFAGYIAQTI